MAIKCQVNSTYKQKDEISFKLGWPTNLSRRKSDIYSVDGWAFYPIFLGGGGDAILGQRGLYR